MLEMSKEIVRVVKTTEGKFRWVRLARNYRPTHKSKIDYAHKHSAVVAAVRENQDIYRERFMDYTGEKPVALTTKVVERRPSLSDL